MSGERKMEYISALEREAPPKVYGRFIRVVERTTGKDIFPCIDVVAEAADKNDSLFPYLTAEVQRAQHLGETNLPYKPEAEYLDPGVPVQETNRFLSEVYNNARKKAPTKPTMPPCSQRLAPPVSVSYLRSYSSSR